MTAAMVASGLAHRYRHVKALDGVDLEVPEGSITGLLGRNGAGKTTLMQLAAGHLAPRTGRVEIFGQTPFERAQVLSRVCLVRESQRYSNSIRVDHVMRGGALLFARWDRAFADGLLGAFELPRDRRVRDLSRGMRAAMGCVVGLASRAELTCFDEPTGGQDAVFRQTFYDALIQDVGEHPRTIVLSTHLIDEVAPLIEHAVLLHEGKVALAGDVDTVRATMVTVTGPAEAVERCAEGRQVVQRDQLGPTVRATLHVEGRPFDADQARRAGLEVAHPSLQEVVVRATHRVDPAGDTTTSDGWAVESEGGTDR